MKNTSRIYIAGHHGMVGSAILHNLQKRGYTNFILRTHRQLDLTNQQAVTDFFASEQPEYVFLSAAKVGGIMANNTYRGEFIYENLMIQNNVIHASYLNKVKKLLFLGSTCIYPREAPQPMTEDSLLTAPLEYTNEPYAIAKIAGIKLCESYNLQYGTNYISVMPTNLYGPNDNFDLEKSHVLPAMLRKIYLGKCLEENNWDALREDLNKRPIEGISGEGATRRQSDEAKDRGGESTRVRANEDGRANEDEKGRTGENETEILTILKKYGISVTPSPLHPLSSSHPHSLSSSHPHSLSPSHPHSLSPSPLRNPQSVSVELWGSGTPMREFLWSEEMADACVYLMEHVNFDELIRINSFSIRKNSHSNEIRNEHINIGTGKEISIHDLAYLIKKTIDFKGKLVFNTSKPDGTLRKLTDPSKLHALGWHHQIEIEEGIEKLYKWYLNS